MRKILLKLCLFVALTSVAWGAIAPVGGATGTTGASLATTVASSSFSPTAGNAMVCALVTAGGVSNITAADNNSNALSISTTVTSVNFSIAYGTVVSGASTYHFSWTTSRKASIACEEYSGQAGFVGTSSIFSSSSTNPTYTYTTTKTNSLVVNGYSMGANVTSYSSTTGNLRQSQAGGGGNSNAVALIDNTGTTIGSSVLTITTTNVSSSWVTTAVEIYPPQGTQTGLLTLGVN